MNKTTLYFLCTGNSCRSQIADGFAKHYGGDEAKFREVHDVIGERIKCFINEQKKRT